MPRFSEDNFAANIAIVDRFAEISAKHKATSGQLALAWLLTQDDVIPIPGYASYHLTRCLYPRLTILLPQNYKAQ